MDGTCKTCRHWDPNHIENTTPQWGICGKAIDISREWHEEAHPLDMMGASDAECYMAWFHTGPEFGCVHHDPK